MKTNFSRVLVIIGLSATIVVIAGFCLLLLSSIVGNWVTSSRGIESLTPTATPVCETHAVQLGGNTWMAVCRMRPEVQKIRR
jgi:hypothetical protein